jgi:hypothetical protein
MLVECTLIRKGGTSVKMDDVEYKFQPNENEKDPRHLCDVKDQQHLLKFLAVESSFRLGNPDDEDSLPVVRQKGEIAVVSDTGDTEADDDADDDSEIEILAAPAPAPAVTATTGAAVSTPRRGRGRPHANK